MDLINVFVRHPLVDLTLHLKQEDSELVLESLAFERSLCPSCTPDGKSNDQALARIVGQIREFLDGNLRSLDDIPLDTSWCTAFQKKVLETARKIPWGKTISYTELAKNAGYPGAVRAAASVMRNNRFPLVIPCHRVIGKGGKIGGFMGSLTGVHVDLKARLLANEGVVLGPQKAKR